MVDNKGSFFEQQQVKMIRLFSGELILAKLSSIDFSDKKTLTLQEPIKIIIVPGRTQNANPTIALLPWNEFSHDKSVDINTDYIVSIETPVKEFVTQYSSVVSGLMIPQAGSSLIV